jgi:hypothetical protein
MNLPNSLQTALGSQIQLFKTRYRSIDLTILDALSSTASKGDSLAEVASQHDIARAEVMAIGDNFNDLTMLRYAGKGIVMANAEDELKQMGFELTDSNEADGVAKAIEKHILKLAPDSTFFIHFSFLLFFIFLDQPLGYRRRQHNRSRSRAKRQQPVNQPFQMMHRSHVDLHNERIAARAAMALADFRQFFQQRRQPRRHITNDVHPDKRCDRQADFFGINVGVIASDDARILHAPHAFGHCRNRQANAPSQLGKGEPRILL